MAESWKVVEVSGRSTEPFTLPELLERFAVVEKERNDALEVRTKYGKDNKDALEQIIPKLRDDPEYQFRGKLGDVQKEWARLLDERKEKEHAYQELKQIVNRETSMASKSVMRQVSVGTLKGNVAVTEMLLNLKPKEGDELPFKVKLRKYDLSEPESDRVEPARWVIVEFEGTTPEAKAAAASPKKASEPASESAEASDAAGDSGAAESDATARHESTQPVRELRGEAKIQILTPVTKVAGDEVVSTVRVRNASKGWIVGFVVTEHWYDQQGNAVGSGSRTHRERFMPGETLEMELRTRKGPNFFQNQFEFSHANGDVKATVVGSFPT
jgi:hypothetical protein